MVPVNRSQTYKTIQLDGYIEGDTSKPAEAKMGSLQEESSTTSSACPAKCLWICDGVWAVVVVYLVYLPFDLFVSKNLFVFYGFLSSFYLPVAL